ncbi:oligosaccharide flippase family protein [Candidatus Pacearchaeota archaeon]|nr:oligosaccharide flippase family protein [Candidatus Pacearchaeota archaeon]
MKEKRESFTIQALSGSIWNFFALIFQRAGALIFTIIIARFLLPEGFGLYNLILSIALTFTVLSERGINESLIRYLSETLEKKAKARNFFKYILKLKLVILISFLVILGIAAYPLSVYFFKKPVIFIPLLFAILYVFVFSLDSFFSSYFFAAKKVKYVAQKETLYQILRIVLILGVFYVIRPTSPLSHIFVALTFASLITLIFVIANVYKYSPYLFEKSDKIKEFDKKRINNFISYFTITSISFVILGNIDTIMLGYFIDSAESIGLYRAAFTLSSSIAGLLGFGTVLLPLFIKMKDKQLQRAFNRVFRYTMIVAVPISFGLAILGNYFLTFIFGVEYIDAKWPLYVLAFLIILGVQVSLFVYLFLTKERPKDYLSLLIGVIILDIILNFIFIKIFLNYSTNLVITGVALASLISWLVYSIGIGIMSRTRLNIKVNGYVIIKPLIAAIVMSLAILYIKSNVNVGIINGIILILVGAVIYFASLFILKALRKEDLYLIKDVIKLLR